MPSTPFTLIVTRLQAQAESWSADLAARGIATRYVGLLELVPLSSDDDINAIKRCVLDLDLYQKVIFVSQNAVDEAMRWIEDFWPQLPMGIRYLAVGSTTAARLAAYGIRVDDLAVCADGPMNSEALLEGPALSQVDGEKILIFRGKGGRGHMGQALRERGAKVDYCELYERRLPHTAVSQWQAALAATDALTQPSSVMVALHSGETLTHFADLVRTHGQSAAFSIPLLVPSERIAELAKAYGFNDVVTAVNATDRAMTDALEAYLATR